MQKSSSNIYFIFLKYVFELDFCKACRFLQLIPGGSVIKDPPGIQELQDLPSPSSSPHPQAPHKPHTPHTPTTSRTPGSLTLPTHIPHPPIREVPRKAEEEGVKQGRCSPCNDATLHWAPSCFRINLSPWPKRSLQSDVRGGLPLGSLGLQTSAGCAPEASGGRQIPADESWSQLTTEDAEANHSEERGRCRPCSFTLGKAKG